MGIYGTKIIDYGYKERVSVYRKPIATEKDCYTPPPKERQKYGNMSEEKQKKSDERRLRYYKRKKSELIDIALMNPDLDMAFTLTFSDSVTSYDYALAEWQLFLKRLRHALEKPLKYICVWEYQKERSKKEGITDGGIFHFHCLMNTGFIEHSRLERLWSKGFVWIDYLGNEKKRFHTVLYTMKYITKEIAGNPADRGKRYIFTSNNLEKPTVTSYEEPVDLEDVIFEHLEDMLTDGGYDIKDSRGRRINHVDYVEYKI